MQRVLRDVGLVGLSIGCVGATYSAASESSSLAVSATLAIAAAAAMHARLAMGRWLAAVVIAGAAAAVSLLGAPPRLVGVQLIAGVVAAELVGRRFHRSAIVTVGLFVGMAAGVASLSGLVSTVPLGMRPAALEAVSAFVGGLAGAPLMLALAPFAERLFGHVTRLSMSDWLNYEHPLLRRLAAAAPGTFQHSVNVGVLADAAANAIGADALLTRVGSLYHDVGKMNAPEYFIENQQGANPHDDLDPAMSARALRAHVIDGVVLVLRYRMGDRVAAFVREHHGTGEMRFFRDRAEALGGDVNVDAFRYPGPSPQSRETGLVMIADQLEATARVTRPADQEACETIVRSTIDRVIAERELRASGLTPDDLHASSQAFTKALLAMYHRRIPYPTSDDRPAPRRFTLTRRPRSGVAS